jgi:hypothetical protein
MGAFYGSIQIYTPHRDAVLRAATDAAMRAGIRCFVGPVLQGWVGVYPAGSGQDQRIGAAIAQSVGGDVLQAIVHDDDVMAYWFWYRGELTDSYWSSPGYFNPADRAAQEQMSGDPQAFGPLVEKRSKEMLRILARTDRGFTIEASRLQQFTELLGIRNGVTSYEYLKAGEVADIQAWNEFEEVPPEAIIAEQAAQRRRQLQVAQQKEELIKKGLLLADAVENCMLPRACAIAGGMLVAWEGYGRGEARIEFFCPPWGEAEPGEIETGGNVNSIAADPAGRRMAMGLGNRVVVWESAGWKPILELVEGNWAVETALSVDGTLLAYACRAGVYVHEIDSGKRLTALSAHGGPVLAFHPGGEYLISAGGAVRIAGIKGTDPWRELYPGGQAAVPPELAKAVSREMSNVDVDALQEKWRTSIEAAVAKLAAAGQNTAAGAALVAKMRQQMEKQLEEMNKKFASLKAGKIPPPREANESVFCGGFTADGKRMWLGTSQGLRIYDWPSVESAPAGAAMPKPVLSYRPSTSRTVPPSSDLVYAAAEVPGRDILLFGGGPGRLCQMDLKTGKVVELALSPDSGAIVSLMVTLDAAAVGVCSRAALGDAGDASDERAVWEIWSYPALLNSRARIAQGSH